MAAGAVRPPRSDTGDLCLLTGESLLPRRRWWELLLARVCLLHVLAGLRAVGRLTGGLRGALRHVRQEHAERGATTLTLLDPGPAGVDLRKPLQNRQAGRRPAPAGTVHLLF